MRLAMERRPELGTGEGGGWRLRFSLFSIEVKLPRWPRPRPEVAPAAAATLIEAGADDDGGEVRNAPRGARSRVRFTIAPAAAEHRRLIGWTGM